MSLAPKAQDWASRWEAGTPPEWIEAVNRITLASLAFPLELADDDAAKAYNAWLEQHHLEPLRAVSPERYRAVVEQVRAFILSAEDDDDDKTKKDKKTKPARQTSAKGKAKPKREASAKSKAKARRKRAS